MITNISVVYNAIPFIILETDEVITSAGTGKTQIEFNELGAYISILTQQQTALGQFVVFSKGTYTQNNKQYPCINITASATPSPEPDPVTIEFLKRDEDTIVPFTEDNELVGVINCTEADEQEVDSDYRPCVVTFRMPVLNLDGYKNFSADYSVTLNGGSGAKLYGVSTTIDGTTNEYIVTMFVNGKPVNISVVYPDHLTFTSETNITIWIKNASGSSKYILNGVGVMPINLQPNNAHYVQLGGGTRLGDTTLTQYDSSMAPVGVALVIPGGSNDGILNLNAAARTIDIT